MKISNKVLFFVMDFWNAGAERMAYEFHLYLSNLNFEVTIICYRSLNDSSYGFDDYYYEKHLKLKNSKVFFIDDLRKSFYLNIAFKKKIKEIIIDNNNVFFFGGYVFNYIDETILRLEFLKRKNIIVQSMRFQGEFYRDFNRNYTYNFFLGQRNKQSLEYEFEGFSSYTTHFLPLCINLENKIEQSKNLRNNKFKIAVFTRISIDKPLDVFLFAFHLLLGRQQNIELHFFGTGDIFNSPFSKCLSFLGIENVVFNHGHSEDISESLKHFNIDLVWYQSYDGTPAGYSALDIINNGVPQIYWDFSNSVTDDFLSKQVLPCFKSLDNFVNYTIEILNNELKRNELVQNQYQYLFNNHNIDKYILNIPEFNSIT